MFNRIELDHIILNTRTLFDNLLTKSETIETLHILYARKLRFLTDK